MSTIVKVNRCIVSFESIARFDAEVLKRQLGPTKAIGIKQDSHRARPTLFSNEQRFQKVIMISS